ncbi:MAG TPA: hypothetical protein VM891_02260, partial [Amaricoccus sp.]|nr:hypothetical protein [Amaricoccus sp.]
MRVRIRAAAEQVDVHDPAMLGARRGPRLGDAWADLGERPGDGDLVLHPEVGAPPDVEVRGRHRLEPGAAVEHHRDRVGLWHRLAQPAAGGDVHRPADRVERDGVAGGECLQA